MTEYESFFQAMSDGTRQRILLLLQDGDRCVGELVSEFHLSQPTISKHLMILKNVGLVKDQRRGQHVFYSLNQEWLRDCCAGYFKKFNCCSSFFKQFANDTAVKAEDIQPSSNLQGGERR